MIHIYILNKCTIYSIAWEVQVVAVFVFQRLVMQRWITLQLYLSIMESLPKSDATTAEQMTLKSWRWIWKHSIIHTCSYLHLTSWQKQSCKDHIRFRWISGAEEISFELLNLRIKDTGTYTCTVRRTAKPPQVDLGFREFKLLVNHFFTIRFFFKYYYYNNFVWIRPLFTVYPVLSLSCVRRPDESPMILCSVEFYHDYLEQLWIRDGDVLKSSFSNKSFNGFFNQQSYLILPPQTFNDTIYSCWVNHSSLNKPLVANLSSSVCYESGGKFRAVTYFLFQCVIYCI